MVQAQTRSVFADPQFVQIIQIFDPLDTPFAVADVSGAVFYSNPSMKRLLRRLGRDSRNQNLADWVEMSDADSERLFTIGGEMNAAALPFETRCRMVSPVNPAVVQQVLLRLDVFSDASGPTDLILCFLIPQSAGRRSADPGVLIGEWLPRIEEIGDSFDVSRLGGKVCKVLEDLTDARAVAFYALRPAGDDGLRQVWRRAEQIGQVCYIASTPFEFATGEEWTDALIRHSPVAIESLGDILGASQIREVPEWAGLNDRGVVLACRARGDVLGLAFVWTDSEPLACTDVRHVLGLVGFQAAQSLDTARWFELTQQSESRSFELIDNANAIILGMDWQGNITLWNNQAREVFGYSSREMLGRTAFHLFGEDETCSCFLSVLRDGKVLREVETSFADQVGRQRHVIWNTSLIQSAQGAVLGLYAIGQDVTERRNLEAQMLQAQKNESIGTLSRGIAHDFNNILNGINGFLYLLRTNGDDSEKSERYIGSIKDLTARASGLTRQLQAYARQTRPEKQTVDLNELIRQTMSLLSASVSRNVAVDLRLADELEWIEGDRSQIEQVIMNLCLNAAEAMPQGGRLTVQSDSYCHEPGADGADAVDLRPGIYCRVRVCDTGCGMTEEVRRRVFDPFYTTKKTGNGLGLSAVYGILEGHRGTIGVESRPGKGSVFTFYLPAAEDRRRLAGDSGAMVRGGNETVLVVDDEPGIRLLAEDILSTLGYRVVLAEDGEEAVRIFQERPDAIHLVVMDIAMPHLNGRSAAKAMRLMRPDLKVLFTSGFSDRGQVESLAEDGFVDFLPKPYAMFDLQAAVRKTLNRKEV